MARSTDPAKLRQSVSPRRRAGLQRFAYNPGPAAAAGSDSDGDSDTDGSLSSVDTVDMEDIMDAGPPAKRRRGAATANEPPKPPQSRPRRMPAAPKQKQPKRAGREHKTPVQAPPNWELMYDIVKEMREMNPTAPVDTMGCAELYSRSSSARDRRLQILTALMLSSQTKDTVTAVAMQRLHTELGGEVKREVEDEDGEVKKEQQPSKDQPSTLTLENILDVSPTRLNTLIQTVGFHNNKTKYIKATATILASQYDGDIPRTAPELMKLPGVGPKMAYLCMSAAWDKHDGIGVDVHVHRITNLWGWNHTRNPEETREALQSWLPREKWHEINKLLVGLGQTVCLPVKRRCGECALAGRALCRSELKK